jgi:L-ascorbate metabolism protein UlaG (beta-lactamase superfamily)
MKTKNLSLLAVLFFFALISIPASLSGTEIGQGMQITFLGHAAFKLVSPQGVIILIDPFLKNNPKTPPAQKEVEKADLILVTHGHADHLGDALAIAQKTNASVVAIPELAVYLTQKGLKNVVRMNKGGSFTTKGIRITMVNALHSSSITEGDQVICAGDPAGFIIRLENGFTVYHAGDTAVFSDMKIIADLYAPQLALLPIGSHFTMDPKEAAYACKLLQPKYVVPMHYGTWPVLTGTSEEFARLLKDQPGVKLIVMNPGSTIE